MSKKCQGCEKGRLTTPWEKHLKACCTCIEQALALLKQPEPTCGDCPYKPEPNPDRDREKLEIRTEPTGEVAELRAELAEQRKMGSKLAADVNSLGCDCYNQSRRIKTLQAQLKAAKEMHNNALEAIGKLQEDKTDE